VPGCLIGELGHDVTRARGETVGRQGDRRPIFVVAEATRDVRIWLSVRAHAEIRASVLWPDWRLVRDDGSMALSPRTAAFLVGTLVFIVLFPTAGVTRCAAGDGCTSSFQTFWGLTLPPGAWSSLPALVLSVGVGSLTYRRLSRL
jgi:hypothetical protein